MKRLFTASLLFITVLNAAAQGYKVTLHTKSYTQGLAYLTYYYGANMNIQDSAIVSNKGIAVFKNIKPLPPGVYAIVFPGKNKLFDFFVDKQQVIDITADTTDLVNGPIVTGSKENDLFREYQKYIDKQGKLLNAEQQAYNTAKTKADSVMHEQYYQALNRDLTLYREDVISKHPETMLATLFESMRHPQVLNNSPATKADSAENYNYYKSHYWDGISFMDSRVIRTPFFLPKLEKYYREVLTPASDSIVKEADYMLLLARSDTGMYQFLLNWLTDEYINPKYMGQDAVFVHLFNKYHSKGLSTWLSEKQHTTISNRAYMLMSNLLGEKAADLKLIDSSGKAASLFGLPAKYTVVVFWDPTCGHCREEVPRLDSFYQHKWKQNGVKMFGVLTENDTPKWVEFIKDKNLKGWTHVYQTEKSRKDEVDNNRPGFRQLYDVTQTPTVYLLDSDKRIIAKKLSPDQVDNLLDVKMTTKTSTIK
ncbi:MAG: thioredoxin-like domain-containing protein [Ginsengibacter sp.]